MKNRLNVGTFLKYMLFISVTTVISAAPVFSEDFQNAVPVNLLLNNKYSLSATLHEVRPIQASGSPAQILSARVFMLDEAGTSRVYQEVRIAGEPELRDCVYHPSRPSAIIDFDFDSEGILAAEVVVATIDSFGKFGEFQKFSIEGPSGAPLVGSFAWGISVPQAFTVRGGVYVTVTSIITSGGEIWQGNPIDILQPSDGRIPSRGTIPSNPYGKPSICEYAIVDESDQQGSAEYNGDLLIELDRLVARFGAQNVRDALERY